MLYETLKQGIIFLTMFYFGLAGGVLYECKQTICHLVDKNKIIRFFTDFIFCILLLLLFFMGVQFSNYGEIRTFIIISFFLGFIIERATIGNLLAKLLKVLYNKIIKLMKKLLNKLKKEKTNESIHPKAVS